MLPMRATLPVLLLALAALAAGCRQSDPPIRVNGAALVVENQTRQEWRNVIVTVNGYYRGSAASLAPGARLDANLANFVTGLGQRFDVRRERVRLVEVKATDASGKPVSLELRNDR
jgi:type IV pilus biogenesis protein CpaD/CtpE